MDLKFHYLQKRARHWLISGTSWIQLTFLCIISFTCSFLYDNSINIWISAVVSNPFRFFYQNFVLMSYLVPCVLRVFWHNHPKNIRWRLRAVVTLSSMYWRREISSPFWNCNLSYLYEIFVLSATKNTKVPINWLGKSTLMHIRPLSVSLFCGLNSDV